jgi:hypothetical protein
MRFEGLDVSRILALGGFALSAMIVLAILAK